VTTSGLTFENSGGLQPVMGSYGFSFWTDGIAGHLEIAGAHNLLVNGITVQPAAGQSGASAVWLHDGAAATFQAVNIGYAATNGILVDNASLAFQSGYQGANGGAANVTGLVVENGGSAVLGLPNNDGTVIGTPAYFTYDEQNLENSGCCSVGGTLLLMPSYWVDIDDSANSILVARGGTVSVYGSETFGVAQASEGGSLYLEGDFVTGAVQASGKSSLWLQNTTANALSLLDGSSAILLGAGVQSLLASAGSSVALASGNYITGPVQIDHASSLVEQSGVVYGVQPYQDVIVGAGLVEVGSAVELGNGSGNGVIWQGNLTVQQNSAIRLSGGAEIIGSITLEQASNAFFNTVGGGGANSVSGGVSCVFSSVLASHVSGGGGVVPPIPTVATTPSAASAQCLSF
jgi:hypothetical protein